MQLICISNVYVSKLSIYKELLIKIKKMKRVFKIVAAVILVAILSSACNHYVCPAYTKNAPKTQHSNSDNS
jgi:energy-converting hydrogenase Eha subunit F